MFKVGEKLKFVGSKNPSGLYSTVASKGAMVEVTGDEYESDMYGMIKKTTLVKVRWIDRLANGQCDGGYFIDMFERVNTITPNPCIVEEVVTTTKRKVVPGSVLDVFFLSIVQNKKEIRLSMGWKNEVWLNPSKLRELTKQLNEIADVLEENN